MARGVGGRGDPRLLGEVVQLHRAPARRPVSLREHDANRVVEEVRLLDRVVLGEGDEVVLVHEPEVELSRLDAGQARERVRLGERELDRRVAPAKLRDRLRHDRRVGGGEGGEAEHPAAQARDRLDLGLCGGEAGDDPVGVGDEGAPGLGQADGPRAALDQSHARLPLEGRDLLRDCRRRESERVCGGGDRAVFGNRAQHPHPSNVEHKRILVNHKKIQWL